jgi:recombination protein RecT
MADIVKAEPGALASFKNILEKYKADIQQLIPKHVSPERVILIAQTALTRAPELLTCDARSVLAGIIQCSILGLELHSALHHAVLVPFKNTRTGLKEATLIVQYQGYVELLMRGGTTSYAEAQPVYRNDYLDIEYGTNAHIIHKPLTTGSRGGLIGAYAYAKLRDGNVKFHWMDEEAIEKRRKVSKAKDAGPWVDWEEEMYAKTPLRHLCKQMKISAELAVTLAHEDRLDQGITGVVETGEGVSLDFLSMSVDEKTVAAKEDLKKRLTAAKTTAATPPAAAPAATVPLEDDPDLASLAANAPTSPAMEHAKEVMHEKAAAEGVQAQAEAPAPAAEAPTPVPEAPKPTTRKATAPKDPMDAVIDQKQLEEILASIQDKKVDTKKFREQIHAHGAKMLRECTVAQWTKLKMWIEANYQ